MIIKEVLQGITMNLIFGYAKEVKARDEET